MFNNNIVIYKFVQDLHFFVTGGDDENELILASVLQGFFDAVSLILRCNQLLSFTFVTFSQFCCCRWLLVFSSGVPFVLLCPCLETMLTKGRHLRTWISYFYALMRLLMEGKHPLTHTKLRARVLNHKSKNRPANRNFICSILCSTLLSTP